LSKIEIFNEWADSYLRFDGESVAILHAEFIEDILQDKVCEYFFDNRELSAGNWQDCYTFIGRVDEQFVRHATSILELFAIFP
jgi:hypothetical protein